MPRVLDPRLDVLPPAQQAIWPLLRPARELGFVLYGGTAVALHLGHRKSVDFDFFATAPLDKDHVRRAISVLDGATVIRDALDTLVVLTNSPFDAVKISFFGRIRFGRIADPSATRDGVLVVASLDDLLATKLKAILDRAEAKDYVDIARMISAGRSLPRALSAFRSMFGGEPAEVLRALGYFEDGDLHALGATEKMVLRDARDAVRTLPSIALRPGLAPSG